MDKEKIPQVSGASGPYWKDQELGLLQIFQGNIEI